MDAKPSASTGSVAHAATVGSGIAAGVVADVASTAPAPSSNAASSSAAAASSHIIAASSSSATAAAVTDVSSSSSVSAPSSSSSGWSGASALVGMLSAAKAGMKLAPLLVEGGLALVQNGTQRVVQISQDGINVGTGYVRSGVQMAGQATALKLQQWEAEASDDEAAARYAAWLNTTLHASERIDRSLQFGAEVLERRVLGSLGLIAHHGLSATAWSWQRSVFGTKLLIDAAEKGTKWALRAQGVNVEELEEGYEHEQMVDTFLRILSEVQALSSQLSDVSTPTLVRCLLTYARLVEVVDSEEKMQTRRKVLSAFLEELAERDKKGEAIRREQDRQAHIQPQHMSTGKESEQVNEECCVDASAAVNSSSGKPGRFRSWLKSWGLSSSSSSDSTIDGASSSEEPLGPAPSFTSDPAPSISHKYEDGLYALAGSGMQRVSRACLFAGVAYGPRFLRFLGLPTKAKTHEEFIVEQTGIAPQDIIQSDFASTLKRPGFYLALDHKFKQIVLVIRGSSAIHDGLVDLTCGFQKHVLASGAAGGASSDGMQEGCVHEGMYNAAMWFKQNMKQKILDLFKQYPNYGLTLTGHSLGAGTASLLTLLWLHDDEMNPPHRRIQCYSFGSPCIVSPELCHVGYGHVWNFILGHDVVCRLSRGAVQDLCSVILSLTTYSRAEAALNALPYRERSKHQQELEQHRRKEKEEWEASKAAHTSEGTTATSAGTAPRQQNRQLVHPAADDHTELATLLDHYQSLLEQKTKAEEEAKTAASRKTNPSSSSSAPSSSSSSSVVVSASTSPSVSELSSSIDSSLSDLRSILHHLRRSMTHAKLFPLGHIFHLLPRPPPSGDEAVEEAKAKAETNEMKMEDKDDTNMVNEEKQNAAPSSHARHISSSITADESLPRAPTRQVLLHVSSGINKLDDLIGARSEPVLVDADVIDPSANTSQGSTSTAALAGSMIVLPSAAPTSTSHPSHDAPAAAAQVASSVPSSSSSAQVSYSSVDNGAVDTNVDTPPTHPSSSSSSNSQCTATSTDTVSSMPISLPPSSSNSVPTSTLTPAVTRRPAPPVALPVSKAAAASAFASASSTSTSTHSSVKRKEAPQRSTSPPSKLAEVDDDDDASSHANVSIAAPPIRTEAYVPPLAAPIPRPNPPPPPRVQNLFTHPPQYCLYAGHWCDLTDLTLSSSMIQHHLPAAYFVALATHETTQKQCEQMVKQDIERQK